MFGEKFQRKYALTDQGVRNTKKGTFWTVIVNLVVMGGVSILYLVMSGFMGALTEGSPLPGSAIVLGLLVLFALLSFVTHLQQYKATYGLVYNEVKTTRLSLAERLRKLDRDYHGRRESDGTCLVSCARVSVRCLHLYGDYRCVPACLRLAVGYCLPVGCTGSLWPAVW